MTAEPEMTEATQPDPLIEADVYLGGFDRIDMPIDWLTEDWALDLSAAGLGALFRLYHVSLRQGTAGSLPGCETRVAMLLPSNIPTEALQEALGLWTLCNDGRFYWSRIVPLIEDAWSRKRGKRTKDAMRKRRERLAEQLVKCGVTETGAASHEVQNMIFDEVPDGARLTVDTVFNAATKVGLIGNIRPVRVDAVGQSDSVQQCPADSPRTVAGQSTDSPRTVGGRNSDSPIVSKHRPHTRSGAGSGR